MSDPFQERNKTLIASLQSMLLSQERQRIQELEQQLELRDDKQQVELEDLKEWIRGLLVQQERLEQTLHRSQEYIQDLRTEVAILRHKGQKDDEGLIARLRPIMSETISQTIQESRKEMAEAMAPVIGDSIRVQIRESREDIAEAIAPVMGDSIRAQIRDSREDIAEAIAPVMGDSIRAQIRDSREDIVEAIAPVMGDSIRAQIRDSRQDIVEAIGPVMGESIRVQIRDSRQDMIEALYPIIGETVQRAVSEFGRDLQRNIDARLKSTFGPQSFLRIMAGRLLGISAAELTLRDSLPFSIQELFFIQHHSGLLLAHYHSGRTDVSDSDLISGMLTAIRDLARDSFGQEGKREELEEIQYGDNRIIIQNGSAAYMAIVIEGVEPTGFRSHLHTFVSELHIRHEAAFRQYDGDPILLPNLKPKLAYFASHSMGESTVQEEKKPRARLVLARAGVLVLLLIALLCVSLPFMTRILPVSAASSIPTMSPTVMADSLLSEPQPEAKAITNSTPSAAPTAISISVVAPTAEVVIEVVTQVVTEVVTAIPTSRPTSEPVPSSTPTLSNAPIKTATPPMLLQEKEALERAITSGDVWVRFTPELEAQRQLILLRDTPVSVLDYYDDWAEVEWLWLGQSRRGWVPKQWLQSSVWPTPLSELLTYE